MSSACATGVKGSHAILSLRSGPSGRDFVPAHFALSRLTRSGATSLALGARAKKPGQKQHPAVAERDVHDLALLVNGPKQIAPTPADREQGLIDPPAAAHALPLLLHHLDKLQCKRLAPVEDRVGSTVLPRLASHSAVLT